MVRIRAVRQPAPAVVAIRHAAEPGQKFFVRDDHADSKEKRESVPAGCKVQNGISDSSGVARSPLCTFGGSSKGTSVLAGAAAAIMACTTGVHFASFQAVKPAALSRVLISSGLIFTLAHSACACW